MRQCRCFDPATAIAHHDAYPPVDPAGRDIDAPLRGVGHGIQRVEQEIDQHLLEPLRVGPHLQVVRYAPRIDLRLDLPPPRLDQHQRLDHDTGHAHRAARQRRLAREAFDLADDPSHARGHLADQPEVFADFGNIAAFEQADCVVGKGMQGGQRLIQFVADPGGHLPEYGELAGLHGAVPRFAQDGFRRLQRTDLFLQRSVGRRQVCRPLGDTFLQVGIRLAQRRLRLPTLVIALDAQAEKEEHRQCESHRQARRYASQQRVLPLLSRRGQQHDRPPFGRRQHRLREIDVIRPSLQAGANMLRFVLQLQGDAQGAQILVAVLARRPDSLHDVGFERHQGAVLEFRDRG